MDFIKEPNRIYAENDEGKVIAEVIFPETEEGICTIERTFVDESLRGQSIASQLVSEAVEQIKEQGKAVKAVCTYAQAWMERQPAN